MAKDPAFLFYSNDFLSGTYTMTDEQVGKFIRLLCLQHQKYQISKKDMLSICKAYDEDIFSKFVEDDGFFFNQRLRDEATKRAKYTESRRNNAKSKNSTNDSREHMPMHMEDENENENINDIEDNVSYRLKNEKKFKKIPPSLLEVKDRISERCLKIDAEKFVAHYESNGWKVGKNPMKNWDSCLTTWSKSNYSTNIKNGKATNGTSGEEQELRFTKV